MIYFPLENPQIANDFGWAANSRSYKPVSGNCSIYQLSSCAVSATTPLLTEGRCVFKYYAALFGNCHLCRGEHLTVGDSHIQPQGVGIAGFHCGSQILS